jgi:Ni,Fe-hydrogenase I cytochrome b subunit
MPIIALLLLLLLLAAFGGGFALNWLWIAAVVLLVLFVAGFFWAGPVEGGPRRYYGRW